MNTPLMFGHSGDERATPQAFFNQLNAEFHFDLDAAATTHNRKCELYFGPGGLAPDALVEEWGGSGATVFVNPPYSHANEFVCKASAEADKGAVVVCLLPVRSDTQWWHGIVWDGDKHRPRSGVELRLLKGRLAFELHVPIDIRAWVTSEMANLPANQATDRIRAISAVTGLPPMAVARISEGKPDADLLESAPFPSCVVVFRGAGSPVPVVNKNGNLKRGR